MTDVIIGFLGIASFYSRFCPTRFIREGWGNDLSGRMASIAAMLSLARKLGCDVSQEARDAALLYLPQVPLRHMQ